MIAPNFIASKVQNRRVATIGPKIRKLLFVCLCACLWTFSGCHRLFSKPEAEIQLPDGDIVGILPLDAISEGAKGVMLVVQNFSGHTISILGVDNQGGVNTDEDWGSTGGGITISIPTQIKTPFFLRVTWQDSGWYERYISKEYGPTEAHYGISKSRLVKITKPLPPDPKTILVILYPNDRVECEVLGEHPSWEIRTDELVKREIPK